MKKVCVAVILGFWIVSLIGCSSTPSGTVAIKELQENGASKLGQDVVVVGTAETKTPLSSLRMFKLYNKSDYIWVTIPASGEEPPQGNKVRVSGPLQEKEFNIIGKVYYIEANSIRME